MDWTDFDGDDQATLVLNLVPDDRKVDLIEEGVDVAIRVDELDDAGLLSRTLGPNMLCAFASPAYLARRGVPGHPDDLARHDRVNFRFQRSGQPARWSFRIGDREVEITPTAGIVVDEGNAVMSVLVPVAAFAYRRRILLRRHM
jgi:DNA-binding transcriptional LysR family regulator